MRYYICALAAGLATAIHQDDLPAELEPDDVAACELAARQCALEKFKDPRARAFSLGEKIAESEMDLDRVSILQALELDDCDDLAADPDDFGDLGIPIPLARELATYLHDDDETTIDADAECSGLNVQSWSYMAPRTTLEALRKQVFGYRVAETTDRRDALQAPYNALKPLVDALLVQLDTDPGNASAVKDMTDAIRALDVPSGHPATIDRFVHTHELGDGADGDLAADAKKPWRVRLQEFGDQLRLSIWPAGQDIETAAGLGVLIEINQGRPALHIGPGPDDDIALIVHNVGDRTLELVEEPGDVARGPSRIYRGAPAVHYTPN